jgi:hypothetical protein
VKARQANLRRECVIHKVRKTLDDGAAISTPHDNSAKSRLLACSRASPDIPAVVANGVAFGSHYTMEAKVQIDSLKLPDGHLRTMFGMHHAAAGTGVVFLRWESETGRI